MSNNNISTKVENAYGQTLLLTLPNKHVVEIELSFLVNAHRAAIIIRGENGLYLEIRAHREALLQVCSEGKDRFERVNYAKAQLRQFNLPEELSTAETGFPWLVANMPWIFKGIDLNKEPYAHYLEKNGGQGQISQLQHDVEQVLHLGPGASLADISEELTGSRQYGGSTYTRVKDVQYRLKSSTTTGREGAFTHREAKKAA